MMAGNPTNWWSLIMNPQSSSSATSSHFYGASNDNPNQDFPCSLSQLLVSGISGEEEKFGISPFHEENSEDQSLNSVHIPNFRVPVIAAPEVGQLYNYHQHESLQQLPTDFTKPNSWSQLQATSCITNIFNLERKVEPKHQHPHHSSHECNGTSSKKARVQHSSPQPSLKVRKEKLGDRITALHQIVSPFGKTDTASVLSEAIGYIRFLQAQIQALSSPYLGNASAGSMGHILQHSDSQHKAKDLRSRGLCLVPISSMQNIASDTGADYWSPALGGSGF